MPSDADLSWRLWQLVLERDSVYAAFAIRGTTCWQTSGEIRNAVGQCVKSVGMLKRKERFSKQERRSYWYQRALYMGGGTEPLYVSPVAPLALAPWVAEERELLLQAVQYVPKDAALLLQRRLHIPEVGSRQFGDHRTLSRRTGQRSASPEGQENCVRHYSGLPELDATGVTSTTIARNSGVSRSKKIYQIARQRLRLR